MSMLLLLVFHSVQAQLTISGTVYDSTKVIPVKEVRVSSTSGTAAITDSLGHYDIVARESDSLYFTYNNKATVRFSVNQIQDLSAFDISLLVRIHPNYKILKDIIVYSKTYRQDSMENREEFAAGFNYEKPGIRIGSSSYSGAAGLDIDELVNLFRFRRNKMMRSFQNRLIQEEQEKYIDYRFNKSLVKRITGLQSPELDSFMIIYRPDFTFTQTSSIADFYQYILDASYEFRRQQLLRKENTE